MVNLPTSQEWLEQSSQLLQARPTTTRITTKYTIPNPTAKSKSKKQRRPPVTAAASSDPSYSAAALPPLRALLTLKTYDPDSGACIKYQTDKAAEVGRLVASLGRLGRSMAAMPAIEDAPVSDAPQAEEIPPSKAEPIEGKQQAQGGGGGASKRKKKGKK
ncbi:signal recognition particle 9 kDa protein-domain-containing protein [Lineolata rhizophorae]|uniref:Signal recognition particle 9 kDa protein-domain-containing protein n=1 Tax=Lineolata rhizophorae TaxID=578093 RepID=A0A6A6NPN8_9PEZI|nr:signal recognition particle 9 kDa protein-domain-containing protein [Lineolata rhizophorae]